MNPAEALSSLAGPSLVAGLVVASVCWFLVLTQAWHGRFTLDGVWGIQKFHAEPAPRVGGLGLMLGLIVLWALAPADWQSLLGPMVLAFLPAFLFGVAEDISKRIRPWVRLLATLGSGALVSLLTDIALAHTGIAGLDAALAWSPLALAFTALAVAGYANAVNIIDGFNGLAAGMVILSLLGLAGIAHQGGDVHMAVASLAIAATVTGFLLLNFPMGRIFLGDGGAYIAGMAVAWLAVMLIERNPQTISPAAVLLACAYPVVEVMFTIVRRGARRQPIMSPDRLHLHSLVKCRLARKTFPHWSSALQNASVAPLLWLLGAGAALGGVLCWNKPAWAWAGLALHVLAYLALYRRLVRFRWF